MAAVQWQRERQWWVRSQAFQARALLEGAHRSRWDGVAITHPRVWTSTEEVDQIKVGNRRKMGTASYWERIKAE